MKILSYKENEILKIFKVEEKEAEEICREIARKLITTPFPFHRLVKDALTRRFLV